jgi:hypothetical protein
VSGIRTDPHLRNNSLCLNGVCNVDGNAVPSLQRAVFAASSV